MMGHLKKAKETLDAEKSRLKIQQSNFERIDERQEMQAKEIREKQKLEIEEKRAQQYQKKIEVEQELLKMDSQILMKRLDVQYSTLLNHFVTETLPHLFWKPAKPFPTSDSVAGNSASQAAPHKQGSANFANSTVHSKSRIIVAVALILSQRMKEDHESHAKEILDKFSHDTLEFLERRYGGKKAPLEEAEEKAEDNMDEESSQDHQSNQSEDESEDDDKKED